MKKINLLNFNKSQSLFFYISYKKISSYIIKNRINHTLVDYSTKNINFLNMENNKCLLTYLFGFLFKIKSCQFNFKRLYFRLKKNMKKIKITKFFSFGLNDANFIISL